MTREVEQSTLTVVCGLLVTLFYLGLLLVEAGSVRSKNVSTVFTRGFTCFTISVVIFWVCGFAFALSPGHVFIGFHPDFFGVTPFPQTFPSTSFSCLLWWPPFPLLCRLVLSPKELTWAANLLWRLLWLDFSFRFQHTVSGRRIAGYGCTVWKMQEVL